MDQDQEFDKELYAAQRFNRGFLERLSVVGCQGQCLSLTDRFEVGENRE